MATVQQLIERLKNEPGYEWKTRAQREALAEEAPSETGSLKPTKKITAATLAGAVTTLGVFVAGHYGIEIDAGASASLTLILTVLAGYFIPE